jgi:phage-related protein (TIGR01555 family)
MNKDLSELVGGGIDSEMIPVRLSNEALETRNAELIAEAIQMKNSLGGALFGGGSGVGYFSPFGLPSGPGGFPGTEQISGTQTLFKNLRWYLVSNFRQLLSELYVEIGLVQTIVDLPVDDALRGGIEISSKQLDEDQVKQLRVSLDRDNDINTVGQAAKWTRLFGGGGVIILTDQDPYQPLSLSEISEHDALSLRAVDMWELFWSLQNTEGYDPSIQDTDFEHYDYYGVELHKSRVLRMKGLEAPSFIRPRLRGWGFSVCEILVRSINQYLKGTDLGFEVLDEFKLDVYKIKNLVNTLLSPNGEQKVHKRIQLANLQKNYQNAIVMDTEDDYDHKQLSFAGLAEAMAGIRKQVASDLRIPMSKLFGSSENTGMGNGEQNDMENYNAMVESTIRSKIKYDILRVCELKCQKLFGFVPDDLEIKFQPLRTLTAEQEENVKTQKFTRLQQAADSGRITQFEYREAINKGNLLDISLDNAGDDLNPDDPQIDALVSAEGANDPAHPQDIDDPGTGRKDTEDTKLYPKGEYGGKPGEATEDQEEKIDNEFVLMPKPFTVRERTIRFFNSGAFDKASYEADGGADWIHPKREEFFKDPQNVDRQLWEKAKEAATKAGKLEWQFVVWWYKKQGGKFH